MKETGVRSHFALRRAVANIAMWGGWAGAIALGVWSITSYNPEQGQFAPQWVGLTFILLIGIAIAGTSVTSRIKLSRTIVDAFKAGFESARQQLAEDREKENHHANN